MRWWRHHQETRVIGSRDSVDANFPLVDEGMAWLIATIAGCALASSSRDEGDLLVQFTTVVEVLVVTHWRLRSQQYKCCLCKWQTRTVLFS